MDQKTDLPKLTDLAIAAAIKAGAEILDVYYQADFETEYKTDNSPLTVADKKAHLVIENILISTQIPILSEEGIDVEYEKRKNWNMFWLVDPLDGTKEFVKRNGEFTVNIALIENNIPIAGVVYVPVSRELYWGNKLGSFKAKVDKITEVYDKVQKLPFSDSKEDFVIIGSRSHMSDETKAFIRSINTNGKRVKIKSKGSSLKICMVAEGNADIYPRLAPTMEWDTAAGHAIARFAGKNIYRIENNSPLTYNKKNLLNPWFVVK